MSTARPEQSTIDRYPHLPEARRAMRFKFAQSKVRYLRDTEPKFTPEQIDALCAILRGESE
jgi:hypothetical protein